MQCQGRRKNCATMLSCNTFKEKWRQWRAAVGLHMDWVSPKALFMRFECKSNEKATLLQVSILRGPCQVSASANYNHTMADNDRIEIVFTRISHLEHNCNKNAVSYAKEIHLHIKCKTKKKQEGKMRFESK